LIFEPELDSVIINWYNEYGGTIAAAGVGMNVTTS